MQLLLLLLAFYLPPRTRAGEIVGGHETKPHTRPYMAFLRLKNTTKVQRCGGFLIHEKFVLTAAHCMKRPLHSQGRQITVTLGAHNISKKEKTQQVIHVKRNIPHPQYNPEKHINDIMLLQLEQKAKMTKEVQILKPKRESWVKPGTVCQVAGWGRLTPNRTLPKTLHEVEMTVQKDEECKKHFHYYDSATQICAGDPNTQKGSFKGDSGGPFICNNVVQAIVSYGHAYGDKKHPANPRVYTKVSPYLAWIEKTMKQYLVQEAIEAPSLSSSLWKKAKLNKTMQPLRHEDMTQCQLLEVTAGRDTLFSQLEIAVLNTLDTEILKEVKEVAALQAALYVPEEYNYQGFEDQKDESRPPPMSPVDPHLLMRAMVRQKRGCRKPLLCSGSSFRNEDRKQQAGCPVLRMTYCARTPVGPLLCDVLALWKRGELQLHKFHCPAPRGGGGGAPAGPTRDGDRKQGRWSDSQLTIADEGIPATPVVAVAVATGKRRAVWPTIRLPCCCRLPPPLPTSLRSHLAAQDLAPT
ncbi:uncharacterized protein LOC101569458 [Octodon degus]|uniref:Uncharacterized protein LOC101569458 n=1 Tax=Octodon degus TaxID=10160 RepID=A0A6P6DU56_OCTDE|nr:uncharacterized protein LOC101569458 [Octodon degus]